MVNEAGASLSAASGYQAFRKRSCRKLQPYHKSDIRMRSAAAGITIEWIKAPLMER